VLIAGIGFHLGLVGTVGAIFLASVQGSLVGGLLLLWRGRRGADRAPAQAAAADQPPPGGADDDDWQPPPQAVPFGPFLALAAVEWMFFGGWLEQRLLGLLGGLIGGAA
jgi:leader peptidase (prepilin peptidase)/N-methyltransferase